MHIVFAGGGAPGTWLPGLAVAQQIRAAARAARITFLGAGKDFESRNATIAGFQYVSLPCAPVGALGATWRQLTGRLSAQRAARRLLARWRPEMLVSLGGHGAAPAVQAAISMGIPVVILEYNAFPTRVAQKYAGRAALVSAGFESVRGYLNDAPSVRVPGNPIRAAFSRVFRRRIETFATKRRWSHTVGGTLVVLTGTGGERTALNENIPKALYKARGELAGWNIIHQSGGRDRRRTQSLYSKLGLRAEVTSYIHDMPRILAAADVAVARPGAITLAELAASGVPAMFVPSASPGETHQRANAAVFAASGASRTVDEQQDDGRFDDRLAKAVAEVVADPSVHLEMVTSMLRLARPKAAFQVASMVLRLVDSAALQTVA